MGRLIILLVLLVEVLTACSSGGKTSDIKDNTSKVFIEQTNHIQQVHDDKTNKVNPIVCSYIIGGYASEQWLDVDNTFKQLKGDEKYKIYKMTECLGEGKGLSKEDITEDVQGAQPKVNIRFGRDTFKVKLPNATSSDYPLNFSNQIAIGADWNALPRIPKVQSNNIDAYKNVIAGVIGKHGFSSNQVSLKQVLKIDIEGDGVDEVVLTASNAGSPLSSESMDRKYSIVMLRKLIAKKVENIILREEYYLDGKSSLGFGATMLYVPFILDANGDGNMEIFVEGIYTPGNFMDVYEVKGRDAKRVLTNGVSA
ncbi:MAG TPA: hypothetical protein VF941_17220 [Clostridia bacterium]